MKVVLIAPRVTDGYRIFPIGLSYIAAALRAAGHDVHGLLYTDHATAEASMWGMDIVATGGLVTQYHDIKAILDIAHRRHLPTILGGGIITTEPDLMMSLLKPTWGVVGEGEVKSVEILAGKHGARGLAINTLPVNLDSLPWPAYDVFEFEKWLDRLKPSDNPLIDIEDHPREYPLLTSRSCPYLCSFCAHTTGRLYRQRSIDGIFAELNWAVPRYRINIVTIYDELFSSDPDRVAEFCRRIAPLKVRWTCQTRVEDVTREMLEMMRDAGCFLVGFGFESHSQRVLDSMRKHITTQQIDRAWETVGAL